MMNLLEKNKSPQCDVGFKSPRRQKLLGNIITRFEVISKEIDEIYPKTLRK